MGDSEAIERRIEAIERTLTDEDDQDVTALQDAADLAARVDRLADRLDELEEQVVELEAATQAVRGYVGNVRSVYREVERTAEAALAKAEDLESRIAEDRRAGGSQGTRTAAPGDGSPESGTVDAGQPLDREPHGRSPGVADGSRGRDAGTRTNGLDRHAPDGTVDSESGLGRSRAFADRAREGDPRDRGEDGADDGGFLAGLRKSL